MQEPKIGDDQDVVTLESGVRIRLGTPSHFAVVNVGKRMLKDEPGVPVQFIEEKGREEENPNDPAYKQALLLHEADLAERIMDTVIATGSEVVSVPEDIPGIADDSWADTIVALDLDIVISNVPQVRYVQWLKFVAAKDIKELAAIAQPLMRKIGVEEKEVAEAIETFPGIATGDIPDGTPPA